MATKRLTLKTPDRVKTFLLIFIVALTLSPGVRNITAHTLHTVADIIAPHD